MQENLTYAQPANIPADTRQLVINGVLYNCEDFDMRHPSTIVGRKDNLNKPNGFKLYQEPRTATGNLQLATSGTAIPGRGLTFTVTEGFTFVITDVGQPEAHGKLKMVAITARENI